MKAKQIKEIADNLCTDPSFTLSQKDKRAFGEAVLALMGLVNGDRFLSPDDEIPMPWQDGSFKFADPFFWNND